MVKHISRRYKATANESNENVPQKASQHLLNRYIHRLFMWYYVIETIWVFFQSAKVHWLVVLKV